MSADEHFTPGPPERYRPGDVIHGYLLLERVSRTATSEQVWTVRDRTGTKRWMRVPLSQSNTDDHFHHWLQLRHLNLLAVVEHFRGSGGRLHVVTEYAERSLADLLRDAKIAGIGGRGIARDQLLPLIRDAADALDHLHAQRAVHRDVKPVNLYIIDGRVKMTHGGFPRASVASPDTGGTAAYMAPEVWAGTVTPFADQYALALTYAELRQGQSPIASAPLAVVMFNHLEGRYEFLPDVFRERELTAVRKALSRAPEQRFHTCSDFVQALG